MKNIIIVLIVAIMEAIIFAGGIMFMITDRQHAPQEIGYAMTTLVILAALPLFFTVTD